MTGVGIIGCGLIGRKRAQALGAARLVACADLQHERAVQLAATAGANAERDPRRLVARDDVDIVIIATTNDALASTALEAIQAGKHVLVEKPAGRTADELVPLIAAAAAHRVCVRVGFNHRYHPAFQKARAIVDEGGIGRLMFLRARYGHGGRLGYDREWRADAALSGGGELIDQGVHLIDLARWFLGDFRHVNGTARTFFWNMAVDDNAFLLLETARRTVAALHVSCTEWKNLFSFELYGRHGKLHVEGLGGSYGVERLAWYRMRPEMGPPDTTIWEYPGPDTSWKTEFDEFLGDIAHDRTPSAGLLDAHHALQVVGEIYRGAGLSARTAAATA